MPVHTKKKAAARKKGASKSTPTTGRKGATFQQAFRKRKGK